MKGLWIKDLKLMAQQKTTMIIVLFVGMLLMIQNETPSFAIGYISIVSNTLVMATLTYDEFEHGMSFLLTLPVSRKQYVREKYLLGLASAMAAILAAIIMTFVAGTIKGNRISIEETLIESYMMICVAALMMAVMMPIQLKFGPEKERVILFAVIIIIIGGIYALTRIKTYFIPDLDLETLLFDYLLVWGNAVLMLPFLFVLVFIGITYQISVRIMERKEF